MDSLIIQTWAHEVAQSQLGSPQFEKSRKRKQNVLVDMDPNIPRKTRRQHKQGGGCGDDRKRHTTTDTQDNLEDIVGLNLQRGGEEEGNDDASIPDPYATPRAKRTVSTRTYRDILRNADASPTRLSYAPKSASASASASSRSSQSTRSTSPVKRAQDLRKLQKPVRFTRQNPRDLAAVLGSTSKGSLGLFKRINAKITSRRGILPLQLRDILLPELGYGQGEENNDNDDDNDDKEEDIAHMFSNRSPTSMSSTSRSVANNDKRKLKNQRRQQLFAKPYDGVERQKEPPPWAAENDPREDDEMLYKLNLLDELEILLDIVARTNDYKSVPRSEAAWNEGIHGRILELAIADHPEVSVENVTRANIAKPFQPLARPELELEVPLATKMIDYALLLKPDPEDRLSNLIRDFVARLRVETFNQSNYEPLRIAPSGVFVETKVETKRYPEAQAQLGIWLATWFNRVSEFRSTSDLVIPVLIATAEDWELWFAMDGPDDFNVCGPLAIGGTNDLLSIYLLRHSLSCLGQWMATDFCRWVELCVGVT
ncbi:hypothetical protein F4801DRAFT_573520 [Xylaria longipes]|nr:hypothetical protein F4801DRAFT_573520 [Xylaria longipes]